MKKEIRYCYGNQWMYAKKENGKFGILTEALDCMIRRNDKLSEGRIGSYFNRIINLGV